MDGALSWLPKSQASRRAGLGVWQPFEERLTHSLGALADGCFFICEIWSKTSEGRTSHKYLQYALVVEDGRRDLVAEASALRYQVAPGGNAGAQQALIDSMGWTRSEDAGNHRKLFPWPLGIADAVSESTRVLRDVWGVLHPSQVTFLDVDSFDQDVVTDGLERQEILSLAASWLAYMGAVTGPAADLNADIRAAMDDGEVIVRADSSGEVLEVSMRVGDRPMRVRDDAAILDAVSQVASAGRPVIKAAPSEGFDLILDNLIATQGLTRDAFMSHITWLTSSAAAVKQHLAKAEPLG